jgi:predicted ATPase
MIYLSSFILSEEKVKNPNVYPYNVFQKKSVLPFVFTPITVLYGNNGSGKSTLLNIMANKLKLKGMEYATSNSFGTVDYCSRFSQGCGYTFGDDEYGYEYKKLPENSCYIKSEDILYEIKKIQQRQILGDGMEYDLVKSRPIKKPGRFAIYSLFPSSIGLDHSLRAQ